MDLKHGSRNTDAHQLICVGGGRWGSPELGLKVGEDDGSHDGPADGLKVGAAVGMSVGF